MGFNWGSHRKKFSLLKADLRCSVENSFQGVKVVLGGKPQCYGGVQPGMLV